MNKYFQNGFEEREVDFSKSKYFYRGMVMVSTFEADPKKTKAFWHIEDFEETELLTARRKAISWWRDTQKGLEREGKYMLPYAGAEEFELGKHAMALVTVSLVENIDGEECEYTILGGDDIEEEQAFEMESMLFGWGEKYN